MKKNLIILTGPTAVGKTKASIGLANNFKGEIISSDSMQIYRHMNIGTAKIREDEMMGIRHHLVDFVDIDQEFTVSDFKSRAEELILDINKEGKTPIVVGGTGLYINSLIYELNFTQVAANYKLRENLEAIARSQGNEVIHNKLKVIDPKSADKIHKNDIKRVIRALEIYYETGQTMTEYNKNFRQYRDDYNLFMIGLNMDRQKLYERINLRVDQMIEQGLIEEVESILDMGYSKDLVALQGIGYKEIISYLDGDLSKEESIDLLKQKSRNYAKRQLTWFRREEKIKWFNKDEYEGEEELLESISSYIRAGL